MNRRGRWALLPVLLLVNGAAVWGQAGWALDHIVPAEWSSQIAGLTLALAFAAAIELIGVFLSLSADDAEDRGLPSGGIRLGSYAIGIVSGALNYSHWDGAAAIAFALLSAISPFLWGINSRVNRARPIAPSRRFWHPRRSWTLIRHMAWEGIALEQDGIADMAARALSGSDEPQPAPVRQLQSGPVLVHGGSEPQAAVGGGGETRAITRASSAEQEQAIKLMLAGEAQQAIAGGLMGASTMRRYQKVWRELAGNPPVEPDLIKEKVKADLVNIIREHIAANPKVEQ